MQNRRAANKWPEMSGVIELTISRRLNLDTLKILPNFYPMYIQAVLYNSAGKADTQRTCYIILIILAAFIN